jgi:hypothetical protein
MIVVSTAALVFRCGQRFGFALCGENMNALSYKNGKRKSQTPNITDCFRSALGCTFPIAGQN